MTTPYSYDFEEYLSQFSSKQHDDVLCIAFPMLEPALANKTQFPVI